MARAAVLSDCSSVPSQYEYSPHRMLVIGLCCSNELLKHLRVLVTKLFMRKLIVGVYIGSHSNETINALVALSAVLQVLFTLKHEHEVHDRMRKQKFNSLNVLPILRFVC